MENKEENHWYSVPMTCIKLSYQSLHFCQRRRLNSAFSSSVICSIFIFMRSRQNLPLLLLVHRNPKPPISMRARISSLKAIPYVKLFTPNNSGTVIFQSISKPYTSRRKAPPISTKNPPPFRIFFNIVLYFL